MYVIEAILTSRVEELYQGFYDYKELFEEIKVHFSENKKVLDILNTIFLALGMPGFSLSKKQQNDFNKNNNNANLNYNNSAQLISNNQSNINLFEGFVTENKNTNLINNDLFENNNSNQTKTNIDLFSLTDLSNSNNLNMQNNLNSSVHEVNKSFNQINNNSNVNKNNNIPDFLGSLSNNSYNNNNLPNSSSKKNGASESNKVFSFIKNKNASSNNELIKIQNSNNINLLNDNSATSFQSSLEVKKNPNDFSDLFGSLKLNGTNKINENRIETHIINNNLNDSSQKITLNDSSHNKKGFSFIKKEKQIKSNGIFIFIIFKF